MNTLVITVMLPIAILFRFLVHFPVQVPPIFLVTQYVPREEEGTFERL